MDRIKTNQFWKSSIPNKLIKQKFSFEQFFFYFEQKKCACTMYFYIFLFQLKVKNILCKNTCSISFLRIEWGFKKSFYCGTKLAYFYSFKTSKKVANTEKKQSSRKILRKRKKITWAKSDYFPILHNLLKYHRNRSANKNFPPKSRQWT